MLPVARFVPARRGNVVAMRRWMLARLTLLLVLVFAALACAADDDDPGAGEAERQGSADVEEGEPATSVTITYDGTEFSPEEFTVPVGPEISITFDNASEDVAGIEFEGIEGADVEPRQGPFTEVVGFTLDEEGDYTYTCSDCPGEPSGVIHGQRGMAG